MVGGAADIHAIFGRNLRQLIGNAVSVSEVAREIGINRTQLSRYLYGEAFPRPDVLHRICVHFDVDARILTEPLESMAFDDVEMLESEDTFSDLVFEPVDQSVLGDGFYIEWKASWLHEGYFTKQLMLIYTDNGIRKTKLKTHTDMSDELSANRFRLPLLEHLGVAVAQPHGFALIDQGRGQQGIAMSVFRKGFLENENLYPGFKLSALVFNRKKHYFKGTAVLQKIRSETSAIFEVARSSVWLKREDLPDDIQMVLEVLNAEDSAESAAGA